ncbi:MAG: hypothetical protein RI897_85 [Verrucomicrobiota bacterium]
MLRHVISGTWRFTLVSLGGFSLWAFGGRWFYRNLGEAGLYAVTAVAFVGLALLLLPALVEGPRRQARLARSFAPAFLAYALVWCLMWFAVGGRVGEWLGALLGCTAFVFFLGQGLNAGRIHLVPTGVFFILHTAGYFAGGWLMGWILELRETVPAADPGTHLLGPLAKLAWGLAYGAGFGSGLGYLFHVLRNQPRVDTAARPEADSNPAGKV